MKPPAGASDGHSALRHALVLVATLSLAAALHASVELSVGKSARGGLPATLTGPFGTLELTPIVISPPLEYLPRELAPPQPPQWTFAGPRAVAEASMLDAELPALVVARLMSSAELTDTGTVSVRPDVTLIRGLAPDARARLYMALAARDENTAQRSAYRYHATSAGEWLDDAPLAPATRALVEPLIYRRGSFVYFADLEIVRPLIDDPNELRRLRKRLLRQVTVLAKLRIDRGSDLEQIAAYWSRGGRRTDVRPILESVAESSGTPLDISHLLPTLAREYLYRYPRTTPRDLERSVLVNCLWTALNFFNPEPDDRFFDPVFAMDTIRRDYQTVKGEPQLGDLVAWLDREGRLFHVAVHLAGGLVFGKNGASPLAPWSILPLEHFEGLYAEQHARGWQVVYMRRQTP